VFLAKSVKHPFLNEISRAQNLSNLLQTVGVDILYVQASRKNCFMKKYYFLKKLLILQKCIIGWWCIISRWMTVFAKNLFSL
jgi:hypothetical protein